MNGWTFATIVLSVAILGFLIWAASQGSIAALLVLGGLSALLLLGAGAGLMLVANAQANRQAERAFRDNAQENLAIMQRLQAIQNAQNKALLDQVQRTPPPEPPLLGTWRALDVPDGVFDELDEV